jgi:3',5'-cyclic AMP phosphodiesterase CpdA
MIIMKNLTRRTFLERMAAGVGGSVALSLSPGCASLTERHRQDSGPVKILALGDMHVLDSKTIAYPRKVIQSMNKEGGDLVLACGDLSTNGQRSELELARDILDELKMPYYPVLGNHDALYAGDKEETLFAEVFSLEQNSYHFVKNGIHFLAVDHGCGKNMSQNSVSPRAMVWIKNTLTKIPEDQPVIVFSHYPFADGVKYRTQNSDAVQALFNNKKLLAMVGGHFHGNTQRRENGILMTTTACCSGTRGNHDNTKAKGFRVFHIDEAMSITTEFREVTP